MKKNYKNADDLIDYFTSRDEAGSTLDFLIEEEMNRAIKADFDIDEDYFITTVVGNIKEE